MKFTVSNNGKPATSPIAALARAVRQLSYFQEKHINTIAATALDDFLDRVGNKMRAKHGNRWPRGTGPTYLSMRTGRGLAGLTSGEVVKEPRSLAATITVPKYLAYQEFGYISTAKGKYLTIPLPAALNADGTPKRRSARGWQNTFVVQGKRGQLTICTKIGRRVVALYALKPSIRIAPRLGLRKAMTSETKMLKSSIGKRIRQLLDSVH